MKYSQMDTTKYWIALKKLPRVGDITFIKLIKNGDDICDTFNQHTCEKSFKDEALTLAERELNICRQLGITVIRYTDDIYPETLKEIYSPPPILYALGKIDILSQKDKIAIVGSRNPTIYGKNATIEIVKNLSGLNIVTVSGFAKGIDTIVHETSINNKISTIGVLGCGINIIYPASNKNLYKEMIRDNLLITEFDIDTKPDSVNFPKRNRIISGISKSIVVTEASMNSGSLITAEFGNNQGKDIFAIPGSIFSYKSQGTNFLIKSGAYLLQNSKDILEISFPHKVEDYPKNTKISEPKIFTNEGVKKIYELIEKESPTLDNLILKSRLTTSEILPILTNLQILGYIKEGSGKIYEAVN